MDILGSHGVDDLNDIKQAILLASVSEGDNESDGDDTSDVEGSVETGNHSKPPQKCLGKCASFPSAASLPEADHVIETASPQIFSQDSVQSPSPYARSLSLPTPSKLVSALKGTREKQGLPPKKLTVKWAPDVYDPPPTSVLHTVRSKKQQQKSKKSNAKKKNGKKGQKGNNSSRGSGRDNKQFRRGGGSSDRSYKPLEVQVKVLNTSGDLGGSSDRSYKLLEVQDRVLNTAGDLDDFKVESPDPYCGSSFLKNATTRMHYSVTEAL